MDKRSFADFRASSARKGTTPTSKSITATGEPPPITRFTSNLRRARSGRPKSQNQEAVVPVWTTLATKGCS